MKKSLFHSFLLVIPFIITACSYGSDISKTVIVSGFDFTPFTEKGFLFTPEQYFGNYDAIGLISIEIIPTIQKLPYGTKTKKEGWETFIGNTRYWEVKEILPQEVLDSLFNKAVNMGANAVVRFDLNTTSHFNGDVNFYGLKASGFAIRRLKEKEN